MAKRKVKSLVEQTRSELKLKDELARQGFTPDSPEGIAYARGYTFGRETALEECQVAEPIFNGPLEGREEDRELANEYGLAMGKTEDERWASYRDYLRGLQKGRELGNPLTAYIAEIESGKTPYIELDLESEKL